MIIPNGFGQATLLFTGINIPNGAAITWGFADVADDGADAAAEQFFDAWGAEVMTSVSSGVHLTGCLAKLGPNDTGPSALFTGDTAGSLSADSAPPNVAYLIRKNTALGGRRGRGRCYQPGITEAGLFSDGVIASATLAAIQSDADSFFSGMSVVGYPLYLLHADSVDENGEPIPGTAPPPTLITSLTVDPRVATQRRRLRP